MSLLLSPPSFPFSLLPPSFPTIYHTLSLTSHPHPALTSHCIHTSGAAKNCISQDNNNHQGNKTTSPVLLNIISDGTTSELFTCYGEIKGATFKSKQQVVKAKSVKDDSTVFKCFLHFDMCWAFSFICTNHVSYMCRKILLHV